MKNRPMRNPQAANPRSLSHGSALGAVGDPIGLTDQDARLWEAFVLDDDLEEAQPEYGDFWMEREEEAT